MTMNRSLTDEEKKKLRRAALERWSDPAVFANDVLRTKTWTRQREIILAVANHSRVAVRSGHKIGKSSAVSILALWWVLTRPRARVVITAPSHRQVEGVLWKEITRLYNRARYPIGGNLHMKPESGLQFKDGREVIGFSTVEPERMAGFSGPNMLFIVDEASGVEDPIWDALSGNMAGGARVISISNPTRTSGEFYEAFNAERSLWHCIHVSSLECAEMAPLELGHGTGLATKQWCDERLLEWGPDDPRYQVRVLGNFPTQADNATIPAVLVDDAVKRWGNPPTEGPLQIGVDVARFGPDYSSIVWSRGNWASLPTRVKGLDNVEVAGKVLETIRQVRMRGEPVRVLIDASNNGGVADILRHSETEGLTVVDMVASESATRAGYSRLRDEAWSHLRDWLKKGGAIPNDRQLISDLVAPTYTFDVKGRMKVESKLDMRKRIGRSTDDADALALAVYQSALPSTHEQVFSDEYKSEESSW
jgi:hypothetical protein